jgi:Skp family chaperone for outer membrane proteins
MRLPSLRYLLAACMLASASGLLAQNLKFATIDMQLVFDGYYKTKRFEKAIVSDSDMVYLEALEKERTALQEELQQLIQRAQSFAMTDEAKKENKDAGVKASTALRDKERDIATVKRKLERRKSDERASILEEISKVTTQYAKDNQIDLLIDSSGKTLNGIPTLVYATATLDVTTPVLTLLNQGHEAELKELEQSATKPAATTGDAAPAPAAEPKANP